MFCNGSRFLTSKVNESSIKYALTKRLPHKYFELWLTMVDYNCYNWLLVLFIEITLWFYFPEHAEHIVLFSLVVKLDQYGCCPDRIIVLLLINLSITAVSQTLTVKNCTAVLFLYQIFEIAPNYHMHDNCLLGLFQFFFVVVISHSQQE